MKMTTKIAVGAALTAAAVTLLGVGVAQGLSSEAPDPAENETAITGEALAQASSAALASTGEGTVTQTEVGDEDSYYEVEVTLDNGDQVDVQLDENFDVVDTMVDSETDQ